MKLSQGDLAEGIFGLINLIFVVNIPPNAALKYCPCQVAAASLALPLSIAIVGIATIVAIASVFLVKRKRKRAALKAEAGVKTTPPKSKQEGGQSSKLSTPSRSVSSDSKTTSKASSIPLDCIECFSLQSAVSFLEGSLGHP